VGAAVLAVLSVWCLQIGIPEIIAGSVILGIGLVGLAVIIGELVFRAGRAGLSSHRVPLATLLSALAISMVVLVQAVSVRAGVPDYVHDGATHAELVEALRHGRRIAGLAWYPTGFHAPAAALLSLVPALDSASGAVDWAVGLTLLAPLAVFGFGFALWREPRAAAAGALLLALTSSYPYGTHLYSVWPMAKGILLVLGLWTTTLEYLAKPKARLAVLGGLLAGGLLLTHGTEVYTASVGMALFAIGRARCIASLRVIGHVSLGLVCAVVFAATYFPALGGWAAAGGAVAVGDSYFDVRRAVLDGNALEELLFWASGVSSGFVVDLPARLALLAFGAWMALRHSMGRLVFPLGLLFAAIVAASRYVDAAPVRALFAYTLPWMVDDRLVMTLSILAAPLSGLGLVGIADTLARRSRECSAVDSTGRFSWQRAPRLALVFGVTIGLASVLLVAGKFSLQTGGVVTYSAGDAAAFAWLRQHSEPGEVLMNDGAADAGIWAPYKTNISIVLPRSRTVAPDGPELLLRANIGQLDVRTDVRDAACALGVRYVFRGEGNSPSEDRQFPPLEELNKSPALEEIFSSGQAAIFRTRLNCPA
jgi:hypothetical protein